MELEDATPQPRSTASQRIIAGGIVIAFCYWASSVIMTVLLSVLLAYFLDPIVEWLERVRIPRVLGALVVLLLTTALLGGLAYMAVDRLDHFAGDWPKYSFVLRKAAVAIEKRIERFEQRVSEITPQEPAARTAVQVTEGRPLRSLLLRGLGSLYTALLTVTFVPFLVFFMLAAKRDVWHATLQLFPTTQRTRVKETLAEVSRVLRGYVAGNFLVATILTLVSWGFFLILDLDYPFLTGVASGLLNLVPYIGAVLAWAPPIVMGLNKWSSIGPFLGVAGVLSFFHLIALNVLVPAFVGRRVRLNALAVTVALLFWGWMWGALGLILAIPITATIKVICDHTERWKPVGHWLGS
jgi:predicted PurR-regulated permease PerM